MEFKIDEFKVFLLDVIQKARLVTLPDEHGCIGNHERVVELKNSFVVFDTHLIDFALEKLIEKDRRGAEVPK